ncbi:MAG: choice-of-anchor Q domain-containing protein [Acidobacteriota bacterium]
MNSSKHHVRLFLLSLVWGLCVPTWLAASSVCSSGCQFNTIQAAVDAAPAGSQIVIEPGTYVENVTIDKSLTLIGNGMDPEATVVDGNDQGSVFDVQQFGGTPVVELRNLTIANGAADKGGGIRNHGSHVRVDRCVIRDNTAIRRGGGIFAKNATLWVSRSTVKNNSVDESSMPSTGGGIFVRSGETVIESSLLWRNQAAAGGGLSIRSGPVSVSNTTFYENIASLGGGIENSLAGELWVSSSTITRNTSLTGHGGICTKTDSTATMDRTILAENQLLGLGMPPECTGLLSSGALNLADAHPLWINFLSTPADLMYSEPGLLPLADNGGPTLTVGLQPDSPAVDWISPAECGFLDQRQVVRPQDGNGDGYSACDIGAYERCSGGAILCQQGWSLSPWDHGGAEVDSSAPTVTPGSDPIRYPQIWERERELFGYSPRFLPQIVTFDSANRPMVRAGLHGALGSHATAYGSRKWRDDVYLQTLSANGEHWVAQSLSQILQDSVPDWRGDQIYSGTFQPEERVIFAGSSDAYSVVRTRRANAAGTYEYRNFLLHSEDAMQSWSAYRLPRGGETFIEPRSDDGPPVVFGVAGGDLWALFPEKDINGGLALPLESMNLAPGMDGFLGPVHSGVGRKTASVEGRTHFVFGSKEVRPDGLTGQWVVTYDHDQEEVLGPFLMGANPGLTIPDTHNGPGIVADSQGILHVVLGAHQTPFLYLTSTAPNDSSSWSSTEEVPEPNSKETYVALEVDSQDRLHLVSRMVDSEGYSLHYLRRDASDPQSTWQDLGKLVVPKPSHYSIWYHKLSIDRADRLFLTYFYYSHNLSAGESAAYIAKWPEEDRDGDGLISNSEAQAHDPVILMSDDGGDRWRLATTSDFAAGVF